MTHLQIRLEDDEFEAFKVKVDRAGLSRQSAGKEAILRWASPSDTTQSPLGDLTGREEAILCAVLELLRNRAIPEDSPETFKPSLIEMGRRYTAKRRANTK
jgi:hypothetical protein